MSKYKTEQRKILVDYFEHNNHQSLSAQEIFTALDNQDISMSAIYRNLSEMEKEGIVCKVDGDNRQTAYYQYINSKECIGAIHLKCQTCDTTLHLNHNIAQMMMGFTKEEYGFIINPCGAFLYGKCAKCSQI